MSPAEWELLCDGCGKCCLNKLEIDGKIHFTCVRCRFLDAKSCLCRIYENRFEKVPDCRSVDLKAIRENRAGCRKHALTGCWTTAMTCPNGIRW